MHEPAIPMNQAQPEVPATRRWGALLLGAVLLLPLGFIVLASSAGPERWLGLGLGGLALYLIAGAFVPRLLRFGGLAVPVYATVPIIVATVKFAEGELLWGAAYLGVPLGFLALDLVRRRRHSATRG